MTECDDMGIKYDIIGGPQNGSKVTYGADMPSTIYMQRTPNKDGFQPWGSEPSPKFCLRYERPTGATFYYWQTRFNNYLAGELT